MKQKLFRIRSPWRRLLVNLLLSCLVLLGWVFYRPRAQAHWLGRGARPLRLERLLFFYLHLGGLLLLPPHAFMQWSILWGGISSLFVILHSLRLLFPRKRYHWVMAR